jgi:hypothetical protein
MALQDKSTPKEGLLISTAQENQVLPDKCNLNLLQCSILFRKGVKKKR